MRSIIENKVLVNNSTTVTNGEYMGVSTCDELSVQVITNSTDFTVNFEVSLDGTNWSPIAGRNVSQIESWDTTTTTANSLYALDISTCVFFRARVSELANGTIKIMATSYSLY